MYHEQVNPRIMLRKRTFRNASFSFSFSGTSSDAWNESSEVSEQESSVSGAFSSVRYGRTEYSPVSQINMLPVEVEAVSMRWFCGSFC